MSDVNAPENVTPVEPNQTTPAPVITIEPDPAPVEPESTGWEGVQVEDPAEAVFIQYLQDNKLKPDDPAVQAAQKGDFSLLEAKLAAAGAKGYDKVLALAKGAQERLNKEAEERDRKTEGMLHETFGGADGFKEVREWARKNGEPHELEYFNAAFKAGGLQARAAALLLRDAYTNAVGTTKPSRTPQNVSGSAPASVGPLSPKEYGAAVVQLRSQNLPRGKFEAEYAQLQARRRAWRG